MSQCPRSVSTYRGGTVVKRCKIELQELWWILNAKKTKLFLPSYRSTLSRVFRIPIWLSQYLRMRWSTVIVARAVKRNIKHQTSNADDAQSDLCTQRTINHGRTRSHRCSEADTVPSTPSPTTCRLGIGGTTTTTTITLSVSNSVKFTRFTSSLHFRSVSGRDKNTDYS